MIGKLMKYDLKRMTSIVKWFYPVLILFAVVIRLFSLVSNVQFVQIAGGIASGIFYGIMASTLVNTVVHIIRNVMLYFFKDQSYLTHTLPITKKQLFTSKFLSSLIFMFTTLVVIIFSLFIAIYSSELMEGLRVSITSAIANFNMGVGLFLTLIIGLIVFQLLALTSMGLSAMIMGYFKNRKKGVKSVAYFGMFYAISMVVMLVVTIIVSLCLGNIGGLFGAQIPQKIMLAIMIVGLVLNIFYAIFFFFFGQKKFERGVNVD